MTGCDPKGGRPDPVSFVVVAEPDRVESGVVEVFGTRSFGRFFLPESGDELPLIGSASPLFEGSLSS